MTAESRLRPSDYLRARRAELVAGFRAINSPVALVEFQASLAAEIIRTENETFRKQGGIEHREHLTQIRLIGDALAWMLLHPHAIRQLARHPGAAAALTPQGDAFDYTLETARRLASADALVLIADLTNVIRMADLVLCNDRERPQLIECAPDMSVRHLVGGRKGRQLRRALAAVQQLVTGRARHPGHAFPTVTLEISSATEMNWESVDEVVREALVEGHAVVSPADGDVIAAVRKDADVAVAMGEMAELTARFQERPIFGMHSDLIHEPDAQVPPPLAWPVSEEVQDAAMERDVLILHTLDPGAFGRVEHNGRTPITVAIDEAPYPFKVDADGVVVPCSSRFLDDVLFGFASIRGTALSMIDAAYRMRELESSPDPPQPEDPSPFVVVASPGGPRFFRHEDIDEGGDVTDKLPAAILRVIDAHREPGSRDD